MKFKNIEVGMKLQNKETGEIYLVLSNSDYVFTLNDYYIDKNGCYTNLIYKVDNDAIQFRKTKLPWFINIMLWILLIISFDESKFNNDAELKDIIIKVLNEIGTLSSYALIEMVHKEAAWYNFSNKILLGIGNTNLFYSNDELKAINNYKFNKDL